MRRPMQLSPSRPRLRSRDSVYTGRVINDPHTNLPSVRPVDSNWILRAEKRQLTLTKPPGSLGRLEEIANRCVAIAESMTPTVSRPRIVVFAGDHGVCAEGVSPYPQAVTAQMVLNFLHGGAAINALAGAAGADLRVVDAGVASAIPEHAGLLHRRIADGTRNFCVEAAMTREQTLAALQVGVDLADEAAADGRDLLGFGEMGIGNTTPASAIAALLTGLPIEAVVGRGAGADDAMLARKMAALAKAIALHGPHVHDAFDVLARVGGFEIAAMTGYCVSGAAHRRPIVVDGFIATAAAALAVRLAPNVKDYLFAAHRSIEQGHSALLDLIGQRPLLDLAMRLGEGTGGAVAMTVIRGAVAAFTQMATFESANISGAA